MIIPEVQRSSTKRFEKKSYHFRFAAASDDDFAADGDVAVVEMPGGGREDVNSALLRPSVTEHKLLRFELASY